MKAADVHPEKQYRLTLDGTEYRIPGHVVLRALELRKAEGSSRDEAFRQAIDEHTEKLREENVKLRLELRRQKERAHHETMVPHLIEEIQAIARRVGREREGTECEDCITSPSDRPGYFRHDPSCPRMDARYMS